MDRMEQKVGVIGDWESIAGFRALGLSIAEVSTADEADTVLNAWTEDGYAVVFVTEALAQVMGERLADWRLRYLPAVIVIPSAGLEPFLGRHELRTAIRKATGIDLIGQRERTRRDMQECDT